METPVERSFMYQNFHFTVVVESMATGLFLARVRCLSAPDGQEPAVLPPNANPYGSEEEAMRHGEQQAMQWVHERTGDRRTKS